MAEGCEDEDYNVAKGRGGEPQLRKTREHSWKNKSDRKAFLKYLAASSNVTFSAKMAGLDKSNGYAYRRKHPDFCEEWRQALYQARNGLMDGLHELAAVGLATPFDESGEVPPVVDFSVKLALTLIKMHGPTANGENDGYGRGPKPPRTADELRALIMEKLRQVKQRYKEAEEAKAAREAESGTPEQDGSGEAG